MPILGPARLQGLLDSIVDVGSRRTLQRELGNLCKSGLLERIGQTRATAYALTDQGRDTLREQRARYHPIDTSPIEESALVREDPEDTYQATPASERLALRDQVRRPQQKRKPVGYRREALPRTLRYRTIGAHGSNGTRHLCKASTRPPAH